MSKHANCPLCGHPGKYEDGAGISIHDEKGTPMRGTAPFFCSHCGRFAFDQALAQLIERKAFTTEQRVSIKSKIEAKIHTDRVPVITAFKASEDEKKHRDVIEVEVSEMIDIKLNDGE